MQQIAAVHNILKGLCAAVVISAFSPLAVLAKSSPPALHIPGIKVLNQQRVIYRCAGDIRLPVRYLNTDAGALAYLPAGGAKLVFVNVFAASGAKYVAGRYVWWSKGKEAFLSDAMEESAEPLLKDCRQVEKW